MERSDASRGWETTTSRGCCSTTRHWSPEPMRGAGGELRHAQAGHGMERRLRGPGRPTGRRGGDRSAPNSLGSSFVGRSEVNGRAGRCLGHLLESAAGRVASAGSVGPPRLGRPAGSRREARRLPGRRGSRQQPARGSRDALIGLRESRTRGSRSAARAFICVAAALFLGSATWRAARGTEGRRTELRHAGESGKAR